LLIANIRKKKAEDSQISTETYSRYINIRPPLVCRRLCDMIETITETVLVLDTANDLDDGSPRGLGRVFEPSMCDISPMDEKCMGAEVVRILYFAYSRKSHLFLQAFMP
jgi:hypothetical protein